jgi:hypothetical protein
MEMVENIGPLLQQLSQLNGQSIMTLANILYDLYTSLIIFLSFPLKKLRIITKIPT